MGQLQTFQLCHSFSGRLTGHAHFSHSFHSQFTQRKTVTSFVIGGHRINSQHMRQRIDYRKTTSHIGSAIVQVRIVITHENIQSRDEVVLLEPFCQTQSVNIVLDIKGSVHENLIGS